jgi:hypothetical protein
MRNGFDLELFSAECRACSQLNTELAISCSANISFSRPLGLFCVNGSSREPWLIADGSPVLQGEARETNGHGG